MNHVADNWYFGWGWLLWLCFVFLMFSSIGNWGYTFRAHRKYDGRSGSNAIDILNERYARGEVTRDQFLLLKSDISKAVA
jgi:putative membrane protein